MSTSVCVSVCVSVCLSARISPEPHKWSLPNILCMLPMAVARSSSCGLTKSQGEGAILGFSSTLTMHCTAWHLGPIQKRLYRSKCRLGWWLGLARGTVCYMGVTIPKGEGAIFEENVPDKPNTPEFWIGLVRAVVHDRGRHLIASVGRVNYWPWNGGLLSVLWMTSCFFVQWAI